MPKKNDHLVIGYCHPDFVRAEFCRSMLQTTKRLKTPLDAIISIKSGPLIASARNDICSMFLTEHRASWLLMVDTDMVFTPEAIDKLVQAAEFGGHQLLGGLCFTELTDVDSDEPLPTMYELKLVDDAPQFVTYKVWPEDTVFPVAATGAAFLLMHRYALERIASGWGENKDTVWPWFRESTMQGHRVGEDMGFCLRAQAAGLSVAVHTGVRVGHMKSRMLGSVS